MTETAMAAHEAVIARAAALAHDRSGHPAVHHRTRDAYVTGPRRLPARASPSRGDPGVAATRDVGIFALVWLVRSGAGFALQTHRYRHPPGPAAGRAVTVRVDFAALSEVETRPLAPSRLVGLTWEAWTVLVIIPVARLDILARLEIPTSWTLRPVEARSPAPRGTAGVPRDSDGRRRRVAKAVRL